MPERILILFDKLGTFLDGKTVIGITGTTGTVVASKTLEEGVVTTSMRLTDISIVGGLLTCLYMFVNIVTKVYTSWKESKIQDQEIELNNQKLKRRHDGELD